MTKLRFSCCAIALAAVFAAVPVSMAQAEDSSASAGHSDFVKPVVDESGHPVTSTVAGEIKPVDESGHAEVVAESPGFPQLNTESYPKQLFWLFTSFILLYALMSKLALPRVTAVIDTRAAKKDADLAKAAEMSAEAEKLKNSYAATLARAQDDAQSAVTAAQDAITAKLEASDAAFAEMARKRLLTAEQTVNKAKQEALSSMADIAAEVATDMVNKVANLGINKADAKKSVTAVMQKGE